MTNLLNVYGLFYFCYFLKTKIFSSHFYNDLETKERGDMDKKLFAFDLDGTLLSANEEISDYSKQGIKRLRELGHEVVLITGRSLNMTSKIYEDSGLTSPLGVFNGAVIISDEIDYESKYVDGADVKEIINNDFFIQHTSGYVLETLKTTYTNDFESPNAILVEKWTGKKPKLIDKGRVYENTVVLIAELNTQNEDESNQLTIEFKKKFPNTEISNWYSYHTDKYILEVSRKDARKDFALIAIAEYYGIEMKNTIAFGDGNNDQHMLIASGHGVAMLNAPDFVKEYADSVTKNTNDNDGAIKYALEYIEGGTNAK